MVAGSTTCRPACSRETSNARVSVAVGRFQEDPPLVSCFLANEPLDVPAQQLDGRNERVANVALISLLDDGWVAQLCTECSSSHKRRLFVMVRRETPQDHTLCAVDAVTGSVT